MKIIRLIAILIFLIITLSCTVFRFLIGDWWTEPIDLNKIKENLEAIKNVRVIEVFYDDVDLDWVGAVIIIDENKLLILRSFREEHFLEDCTSSIEIARIGNYRVSNYIYDPNRSANNQIYRSDLILGKNTEFYNTLFNLGEINNIESIIKKYDLLLNGVEQLPDDDISMSNPHNNYGFWNPHDPESKNNLLHFNFSDRREFKIGKIKYKEINDDEIFAGNIPHWELLKF